MKIILLFLIIVTLSLIAYQDFRFRAVTWILFPILAILGLIYFYNTFSSYTVLLWSSLCNLSFIAIQLLLLVVYFSLKNRNKPSIALSRKIGVGDIFFLLATSCLLPFPDFILFYIASLLFSLLAFMWVIRKKNSDTVPLAGLQSLVLITWLILNSFIPINSGLYSKLLFV